ncbi:MAG: hypothetical protein ISP90_02120, partial [Nevskia sp.]|nr:hypothetical protein [Nevskia sp.]
FQRSLDGQLFELGRILLFRYLLHLVFPQVSMIRIDPWKTKFGGHLKGPGPTPNLKIAKDIAPIDNPDGFKQWIEDAIRNFAVPATFSREVLAIQTSYGPIISVYVPPCRHLVSVWDREQHSIKYPRRTSHGIDWMNPDEAERHIMNGSRSARLALNQAAQAATSRDGYGGSQVELLDSLRQQQLPGHQHQRAGSSSTTLSIVAIRDDSFDLRVIQGNYHGQVSIPFGVVRDSWLTPKSKVGLLLDVLVVIPYDKSHSVWLERL